MADNLTLTSSDIYLVTGNTIVFKKKFRIQNIMFYIKKVERITTFHKPDDKEKSKIFTLTYSFKNVNSDVPDFKVLKSIVKSVAKELRNIRNILANKPGFVDLTLTAHNDDMVLQLMRSMKSNIVVNIE